MVKSSARGKITLFTIGLLLWWWPNFSWSFQQRKESHPSLPIDRDDSDHRLSVPTSAILRLSYDGTRFTGWSAANDNGSESGVMETQPAAPSKRKRRRNRVNNEALPKGFVRSVEGVLRANLAKIYGNIDPRQVVVEGCSRTDRGVHARGMVAQIYCLKAEVLEHFWGDSQFAVENSIPGKKLPHPWCCYDITYFEPLPMNGDLSRLAFALNRMRPSDVQVTGIALVPPMPDDSSPFHPTLSSQFKRYEYQISVGSFQDPNLARMSWYIGPYLEIEKMRQGCQVLVGCHNFSAFQGVPRGADEKKKYREDLQITEANRCHLHRVDLEIDPAPSSAYFLGVDPPIRSYRLIIEGDRFLYKMVRFIVGALVAVGTGKVGIEELERALETGSWEIPGHGPRRKEFQCAPAHALVLASIDYGSLEMEWKPLSS